MAIWAGNKQARIPADNLVREPEIDFRLDHITALSEAFQKALNVLSPTSRSAMRCDSFDGVDQMRTSLFISPEFADTDRGITHFNRYVAVAYVESIGVRYEWRLGAIPDRSQLFLYPKPVVNRSADELAVAEGRTKGRRGARRRH